MLNALRLADGVPAALFVERTGLPLSVIAQPIAEATRKGLLDPVPTLLAPTLLGRRFLNDLQELFLPAKVGSDSTYSNIGSDPTFRKVESDPTFWR
jgi:hypothetical protein